jgi:hypothetical protein
MKIPQFFSKTPNHKRFAYRPRFYNPDEEERLERESRIRQELEAEGKLAAEKAAEVDQLPENGAGYRSRINGSFKMAKKTVTVQSDPSASMLRLVILMVLVIGLIAYLQFGTIALYALAFVFIPFYFYLKFRTPPKK